MYCKYDNETKKCLEVGTGTNTEFYKSIGMEDLEVEKAYDGSYWLKGYTPTKPLSELKSDKLSELSTKASSFEQTENKEMYIISSLGYKVNADPKALRNIEVLIELGVTQFRNYDNENVEVTTDNLKTIKSEIGINSVKLYQQKWAMQDLINKAETIEELNSIEIKFTMMDFTNE